MAPPKKRWLSQTALGKERGVSERAIAKHVKSGLIPERLVKRRGNMVLIDADAAHQILLESVKNIDTTAPIEEDVSDENIPELAESNRRAAHFKADLAKIERDKEQGKLVDAENVKRDAFRLGRMIRDKIEAIPDRLAAIMAAELGVNVDVKKVHKIMAGELRSILEEVGK